MSVHALHLKHIFLLVQYDLCCRSIFINAWSPLISVKMKRRPATPLDVNVFRLSTILSKIGHTVSVKEDIWSESKLNKMNRDNLVAVGRHSGKLKFIPKTLQPGLHCKLICASSPYMQRGITGSPECSRNDLVARAIGSLTLSK